MDDVVVHDSPIHGRGVFATRRFQPGDVVIDGCREVLSDEAVKALSPDETVFLEVIDGQNILMRPPARFVNPLSVHDGEAAVAHRVRGHEPPDRNALSVSNVSL